MLALALGACGFQLRGTGTGVTSIGELSYSVADAHGPLEGALRSELDAAGVRIVTRGAAPFHLELLSERNTRRSLSSTGQSRVAEYELNLEIEIRLLDKEGNELIPLTPVRLARTFAIDLGSLQATNEEEERVRAEMRVVLVSQILRRVDARTRGL